MACTEAELKAVKKYRLANTQRYTLILNKNTDGDVIEWLEKSDNKRGSVLKAIRHAIMVEHWSEKKEV